ncbi:MAG: putative membrane protein, partial [Paracoccaceae bacterium]
MKLPETPRPPRRSFLASLRGNFLTGLVVIAPIGLTIWLIWSIVGWIDSWVLPFVPSAYNPARLIT